MNEFQKAIVTGIPKTLPDPKPLDSAVDHAPPRPLLLNPREFRLAVHNALRYFPTAWHQILGPEFAQELRTYGRIYMHRFRPQYKIYARPIEEYPARSSQAAAIMLMIQNNLDPKVAQYPHELITYGGNGTVFQNWAQYLMTMAYLSKMTDTQTLVLYSGHPLGLFPSRPENPRLVITNGMVIPNYSSREDYLKMAALGVTSYGQMTAGSFMYIGPQGIVHGTTITLLNAGRKYLGIEGDLRAKVYVTSGLGGMSGAQAKAAVIAGGIGVIAEINPKALKKRLDQGWLMEASSDLDKVAQRIEKAKAKGEPLSLGYLGNVVDLWEYLVKHNIAVDLGSDQTSLHLPYSGGYFPVGLDYEVAKTMIQKDPHGFREAVQSSLKRQIQAIDQMTARGMAFWDYGNAFLLEASRAGASHLLKEDGRFIYPSYVEDLMGPLYFDRGFGPFRWVCTSGSSSDLEITDRIASEILEEELQISSSKAQIADNLKWIREAKDNQLVVGSQARILYADRRGRMRLAQAFNQAIARGEIQSPIVLGRDHHDVSGTDSPYRETSNIYDGSRFTADMAVHNVIGDAFRGATWISLHNGGGVGWGEVINGGFGLVLDGSKAAEKRALDMLDWDVSNGLARRAWAQNQGALQSIREAMAETQGLDITLPYDVDDRFWER